MLESFIALLRQALGLKRGYKRALVMSLDACLCVIAVWIAFSLRVGEWILWSNSVAIFSFVALASWFPISHFSGVYKTIFRFAGSGTILNLAKAVAGFSLPLIAVFGFATFFGVPRTVSLLHPILFFGLLTISRIISRYLLVDILDAHHFNGEQKNVIIYGAGSSGQQLALSLRTEPSMHLVGFVDDNPNLAGQRLNGKPVFAGRDIAKVVENHMVSDVLLAFPSSSNVVRQAVIEKLSKLSIKVKTLPNITKLIDGSITVNDLRPISIEDLLGRMSIQPEDELMKLAVAEKIVMITGAGGSIGSELCSQMMAYKPTRIILVEISEVALYTIDQTLRNLQNDQAYAGIDIIAELINVTERDQLARLFRKWKPDIVFHSAAYKHVPLIEANPLAGIRNNIYGTLNAAIEAEAAGVKKFILISTDKAVRPTNIMGTTKRACELILQAMAAKGSETQFSMVRFGNVLGSSGSVVPLFMKQIEAGGPVTLTDRRITRYFMTIPEAAQLVIQAAGMARGGEVFLLDMGEPIRIADLAETIINLSGRTTRTDQHPNGDIEIEEIGLRPGEKLYEELLIGDNPKPSSHPKIMMATEAHIEWDKLEELLINLDKYIVTGVVDRSIEILKEMVPEFNHSI